MIIENKKYFIDQVNSSKANKMTSLYHYSGVGFKKSIINLGVFRQTDKKLVGVLQLGCSFQDKIRLDRYVKENIKKEEYLELNRFSMADSEEKNSESQAISLGIKWIRKNLPNVKLLVSYSGHKEGNYGYIYQATNWEYLGYFISKGFWFIDGEERHIMTLWNRYKNYSSINETNLLSFLCNQYSDVRETWTKQFIYIMRLDQSLTPATAPLSYPKPSTEYPIKIKEIIHKQNDEIFNNFHPKPREQVEYYYKPNEQLFTRKTLIRRIKKGKNQFNNIDPFILKEKIKQSIAVYDAGGNLIETFETINCIPKEKYSLKGIRKAINENKSYKSKYFKYFIDKPIEKLDVQYLCIINGLYFNSYSEVGRYLGVSRQAVHDAAKRKSNKINGQDIIWYEEK